MFVLYDDVWREHAAYERVVHAAVHIDEAEVVVMFVHGVAAVEMRGNIVVTKCHRVAAAAPGIEAVTLDSVACYSGVYASLMVFNNITHGAVVVRIQCKDSSFIMLT